MDYYIITRMGKNKLVVIVILPLQFSQNFTQTYEVILVAEVY